MASDPQRIAKLRGLLKLLVLVGLVALMWGLLTESSKNDRQSDPEAMRIDLGDIQKGQWKSVTWKGRSILIVRRTGTMLESLAMDGQGLYDPDSRLSIQPDAARNTHRSIQAEWLVIYNQSPDTGCALNVVEEGFEDSCRRSRYDWAGRVLEGQPSKRNIQVVPHIIDEAGMELRER